MTASQRALIFTSIIEGITVVPLIIAHSLDWPQSSFLRGAALLHYPAWYVLDLIRFPPLYVVWREILAMALVQWLLWFIALGLSFFFIDIYRRRHAHTTA
jgi:hypothetical protein